ncbi:RNA polymerase subunit sigma-70 [Modestobacter sp. Leaf380]|nr:RNA polymerase subunit sigma-70 [Modestobacter sp. Leaf380]
MSDASPPDLPVRPPPSGPTDGEVLRASLTDPGRFAVLFDRHAATVHRYLARRVGDLADDLLSETFLVAFRRRADYQQVHAEVRPWLLGIATHLLRSHRRSEERRLRALARIRPDDDATPAVDLDALSDRIAAAALRGPIAAALAALKPADRDALVLLAWEQLTYEEIAAVLDVPIGTVRSRLHRARRQTRSALSPLLHQSLATGDPTSTEDPS